MTKSIGEKRSFNNRYVAVFRAYFALQMGERAGPGHSIWWRDGVGRKACFLPANPARLTMCPAAPKIPVTHAISNSLRSALYLRYPRITSDREPIFFLVVTRSDRPFEHLYFFVL